MRKTPSTLALLLCCSAVLRAEPTVNTKLVAVPAPGPVVVDAALADWDLSGAIFSCHDPDTLRDQCSVQTAAMYSEEGLYLSVRWTDASPLGNRANPERSRDQGKGWRGDSLQVHLVTDQQVHVTAWYYANGKEAALDVHVGDIREPSTRAWTAARAATTQQAFRVSYRPAGYVQELFLPWSVLRADDQIPKAGDELRLGLQFNWGSSGSASFPAHTFSDVVKDAEIDRVTFWWNSDAWGTLTLSPSGNLAAVEETAAVDAAGSANATLFELPYELLAEGSVTLAIDGPDGRRVRNLVGGAARTAGKHVDRWDGRDDDGQPVPPGAYRWHGLFNPGITATYRMHFYPHANPPWRTSTGKGGWGSDTGAPVWIHNNRYYVFVLYDTVEDGDAVMGLSSYGTKLWGHSDGPGDGGTVLGASRYHVFYGRDTVKRLSAYTGDPDPYETETGELIPPFRGGKQVLTGIAAYTYRLYVASAAANEILAMDPTSGSLILRIPIEQPHGLALDPEYRLWAVSGKTVVVISPTTLARKTIVAEGLIEPRGLSVDREERVYVADIAQKRVFIFTSEGKPVGAMGAEGGAPALGPWSRSAFYRPIAVAADRYSGAWVVENDPLTKRISRWRGRTSSTTDYVGPGPRGGDGIVDSLDPTRVYCGGMEFRLRRSTVTSSLGTTSSVLRAYPSYVHMRDTDDANPVLRKFVHNEYRIRQGYTTRHGENDYLLLDCGAICIRRDGGWVPCASIGNLDPDDVADPATHDQKLWSDLNADGKVQDDEATAVPPADHGPFETTGAMGWGLRWRSDFSTLRRSRAGDDTFMLEFRPSSFTDQGVPVFDASSVKVVKKLEGTDAAFCATDWGGVAVHQSPITGVDREGNTRWTYPQEHYGVEHSLEAPLPVNAGTVIGSLYVMGCATVDDDIGEVFMVNGYYGQRHMFTHDGLFVQSLFAVSRLLPELPDRLLSSLAPETLGPGAFGGTFTKGSDGTYYLTGMGGPGCLLLTVNNVDALKRLPGGTLSVPAPE